MKKMVVSAVFCLGLAATHAHGSGFAIFTQDATALGEGNAVTAHLDNAAVVYFNPALMNNLKGTQLEAGTTFVIPTRTFYPEGGGAKVSTEDSFYTPSHLYLTHAFNDRVAAGLAIYNPFGLGSEWPDDWQGRFLATKSTITTFNFNPAVSVRVLPGLSVAAGVDVMVMDADIRTALDPSVPGSAQRLKADGTGIGYNVALAYAPTKDLSFGASYRSKVKVDLEGDVTFSGVPAPADAFFPKTGARTSITLPQQLTAGIAYRFTDRLTSEIGFRWEGWSSYKSLNVRFQQPVGVPEAFGGPGQINGRTIEKDWHDAYGANIGGRYQVTPQVALLAGYLYSTNPIPDKTFEPGIPDSGTHLFTVGTEVKINHAKVGLAYGYQMQNDRKKENDLNGLDPSVPAFQAKGTYSGAIHLVSISLGYAF